MSRRRKTVVITGAAGGIGAATVRLFMKQRWDVVAVDREIIREESSLALRADISSSEDISRVVRRIRREYAAIDAVVNNAAEQVVKPLQATTSEEWDLVMAVNVRAGALIVAGLLPLLEQSEGAVVNVSSVHAVATSPGMAAYVASKGALTSLTRAMALELAGQGIRVNAVLPGAVETPMLKAGLVRSKRSIEALAARHPLGRIGQPHDIAEAIFFLADTARSAFITGHSLVIDGGATIRLSTE